MAKLKPCPDCGATISSKAVACPKCGSPLRKVAAKSGCIGSFIKLGLVGVILLAIVAIVASGGKKPGSSPAPSESPASSPSDGLKPAVREFFAAHPEFGTPTRGEDVADWAQGERQSVSMADGDRLLAYLKRGQVVTLWSTRPSKKIWELPAYKEAEAKRTGPPEK